MRCDLNGRLVERQLRWRKEKSGRLVGASHIGFPRALQELGEPGQLTHILVGQSSGRARQRGNARVAGWLFSSQQEIDRATIERAQQMQLDRLYLADTGLHVADRWTRHRQRERNLFLGHAGMLTRFSQSTRQQTPLVVDAVQFHSTHTFCRIDVAAYTIDNGNGGVLGHGINPYLTDS